MMKLSDIRKMIESGLMGGGQPLTAEQALARLSTPNPSYTGDSSPNMMWQIAAPNSALPTPQAASATQAPVLPPQLRNPGPTVADFANRQSPEAAQLQALLGQQPQLPSQAQAQLPPQAMRGMLTNGLFAGASGGLPSAAKRNPNMDPTQLMQLLSRSGLMQGGVS